MRVFSNKKDNKIYFSKSNLKLHVKRYCMNNYEKNKKNTRNYGEFFETNEKIL